MNGIFVAVLNRAIAAGWLVAVVVLLRQLLQKAPCWCHCLLWAVVALRLLLPSFPGSAISLLPSSRVFGGATGNSIQTGVAPVDQAVNPILAEVPTNSFGDLTTLGCWLWLIGMAVMAIYGIASWVCLAWRVRLSSREGDVRYCDYIDTPFILGVLRPRIYLPSAISPEQAACVLAHERAHLHRRDHWWKPLGYALLTVFWFHPLLWLGYSLLCRDIECACDERVVRQLDKDGKIAYSNALLMCSIHRQQIMACPLAFGEVAVKDRIKNIIKYKKPLVWVVAVSVVACLATGVFFLTDPLPCDHTYTTQIRRTPTCSREGRLRYTCSKCWDIYTEPVSMLEHHYGEVFVSKAPNCSQKGEKAATCIDCGRTNPVAVLAENDEHDFENTQLRAPTCTNPGEGVNTCKRCAHAENCTYELVTHDFKDGVTQPGNCTFPQQTQQICRSCGLYEWKDTGPKIPGEHMWHPKGMCTFCGIPNPDYTYPVIPVGNNSSGRSLLDGTVNPDKSNDQLPELPVIRWDPYPGSPPDFSFIYP